MGRGLCVTFAVLGGLTFGPVSVAASAPFPVIVLANGSSPTHVRISAGVVSPCNSGSDTPLFEGTLSPGQPLGFYSPQSCVCEQHTSQSFPDTDWSQGIITCSCASLRCRRNDATIRVSVSAGR